MLIGHRCRDDNDGLKSMWHTSPTDVNDQSGVSRYSVNDDVDLHVLLVTDVVVGPAVTTTSVARRCR